MRRIDDRQKEKWAFLPGRETQNTNLAIFVHGFNGGHLSAWENLADLLPKQPAGKRFSDCNTAACASGPIGLCGNPSR
jgi:hypothetical protein